MHLTELSDEALVSQLAAICLEGHRLTARLVVALVEVEERRLDLNAACTSMFDFCVRRLGMSEGAAFRRLDAARLVRRHPALLPRIEKGELHLSTLILLRPHLAQLTEAGIAELAAAVAGKNRRAVEEYLARRRRLFRDSRNRRRAPRAREPRLRARRRAPRPRPRRYPPQHERESAAGRGRAARGRCGVDVTRRSRAVRDDGRPGCRSARRKARRGKSVQSAANGAPSPWP
jgi:hypothetical protein